MTASPHVVGQLSIHQSTTTVVLVSTAQLLETCCPGQRRFAMEALVHQLAKLLIGTAGSLIFVRKKRSLHVSSMASENWLWTECAEKSCQNSLPYTAFRIFLHKHGGVRAASACLNRVFWSFPSFDTFRTFQFVERGMARRQDARACNGLGCFPQITRTNNKAIQSSQVLWWH